MSTLTFVAHGSRTRTMAQNSNQELQAIDDGEPRPSQVSDQFWLFERPQGAMGPVDGKWMLFYPNKDMDAAWIKAKKLFRGGLLTGISAMKVSTARDNSRASDSGSRVLICYCGPVNDEPNVLRYGENLLAQMKYRPVNSNPFIYYKSDDQTSAGTRATGQRKNHLYKILIPKSYVDDDDSVNNNRIDASITGFGDANVASSASNAVVAPREEQRRGKRKLDAADEVEETRKRISLLSPAHASSGSLLSSHSRSSPPPNVSDPGDGGIMTRVKIRFENIPVEVADSAVVASFRTGQRLVDLVAFLSSQIPLGPSERWALLRTFPTEELTDVSRTIAEAGLSNSVVIARRMC